MSELAKGHISHLFLTVRDFDRMVSFYRDSLGLAPVAFEAGAFAFFALGEGARIALYPGRMDNESCGFWFIVIDVADVERARSELMDRGVAVGAIEPVPYGRAAMLQDPEGNAIEIHQAA